MTHNELRRTFLDFFVSKGHKIIASDNLVPKEDPTLLFTGSGMNQFKDYFLGKKMDLKRAATYQKCLRTADLEKVGKTPYHHTFFEMLGNFSFGDYFKKEAIEWAWEFLTDVLKIDAKNLSVSVYEKDNEAYDIWKNAIGLDSKRIKCLGEADNFWPANAIKEGPDGACGPCSEIFYCLPGAKPVEVWNLVFTQFDRQSDATLKDLPNKNIDTGMGFERLLSVLENVDTNFKTTLFKPIIDKICSGLRAQGSGLNPEPIYAIADHIRAITFAIGDGVTPANEERGYVIRKLIRKASWHGRTLQINEPYLYKLVSCVIEIMNEPYPVLAKQNAYISDTVRDEEGQFSSTLDDGLSRLKILLDDLKSKKSKTISGKDVFKLYDTYGFPIELTSEFAKEQGLVVDNIGFEQEITKQRKRSGAKTLDARVFVTTYLKELSHRFGATDFVGYNVLENEAKVIGLFKDEHPVQEVQKDEEVDIILDKTPFYGESGGQVGDTGSIEVRGSLTENRKPKTENLNCQVLDTKRVDDTIVHRGKILEGSLKVGDKVRACVDKARRLDIARSHTSTHILHNVLRKQFGENVHQGGSLVAQDRLRFDFTYSRALTDEELQNLEDAVNRLIMDDAPVNFSIMNLDEAAKLGALAFFGEKYGEVARVVCVGEYSKELCAGTHLSRTGEIGSFRIISEEAVSAGMRRIEAVTGFGVLRNERRQKKDFLLKIEELANKIKAQETKINALNKDRAKLIASHLASSAKEKAGISFIISYSVGDGDVGFLRDCCDALKVGAKRTVIALGCVKNNEPHFVISLTKDLAEKGVDAGRIAAGVAGMLGGKGGGRADFAQGGGKDATKLKEALNTVYNHISL